jgi:uncharacterized protein (DUF952 family)
MAKAAGEYAGVAALDGADGFIHLSTAQQARSTAALYFKGDANLVLLAVSTESLAQLKNLTLKWEEAAPPGGGSTDTPNRQGEFPHLYGGAIPWSCVTDETKLQLGEDGLHVFPANVQ